MGRRVDCEVRHATVNFNGRNYDGVEVTCTECGHAEEAAGESDKSVRRCLAQMRDNCPEGESNFYVADDED